MCPKRVEVPETDRSPVKILTVLQGASTSEQLVSKSSVDASELSNRSDDGVRVSEFYAENLGSLSKGDFHTLAEIGEESVAQIGKLLVDRIVLLMLPGQTRGQPGATRVVNTSTPVRMPEEVKPGSLTLNVTPVRSSMKRISNVRFGIDEISLDLVGSVRRANFRKFDLGNSSESVTCVGGVTTDNSLSEIDTVVWQKNYKRTNQFRFFQAACWRCKCWDSTPWVVNSPRNIAAAFKFLPQLFCKDPIERFFWIAPADGVGSPAY